MSAVLDTPLTTSALLLGQEKLCQDVDLFGDFLAGSLGEREPSAYFGPISTPDLVRQILLNANANNEQIAAAARELRLRFVADKTELVEAYAARSMEP
jgi:hypothetical protein